MDPNNYSLVRITLVKKENRYLGYINFSMDMPNLDGATLISTSPYSHKAKTKTDLIDFGKAQLRQRLHDFNRNIKLDEIEFIELSAIPKN